MHANDATAKLNLRALREVSKKLEKPIYPFALMALPCGWIALERGGVNRLFEYLLEHFSTRNRQNICSIQSVCGGIQCCDNLFDRFFNRGSVNRIMGGFNLHDLNFQFGVMLPEANQIAA
jgi:hypothetical protein